MQENKIIDDLIRMMTHTTMGNLNTKIESKKGLITLYELDLDILKMKLIRESILDKFKQDTLLTFKKYNLKSNAKISFNPNKLLSGSYLDLKLLVDNEEFNLLISKYRIEKYDDYKFVVDQKISQVFKYIEGLFRILETEETKNLLLNDFYSIIDVDFYDYIERFNINGNGITLSLYNSLLENLKLEDKIKALHYFYENYNEILKRVFVLNDLILDRYRTNISKRKALAIYKKENR